MAARTPRGTASTDAPGQGALMEFVHRQRRGAELVLLVLSLVVGIGAYAAVGLGAEGHVPADIYVYGGWLTALIIAAHLTIRWRAPYAAPVLLPAVVTVAERVAARVAVSARVVWGGWSGCSSWAACRP